MHITQVGTGKPARILYAARIERASISISHAGPLIDLVFTTQSSAGMVAIAKEMEQQNHFPQVYLWENNVVVEFDLPSTPRGLLEKIYPGAPEDFLAGLDRGLPLKATGEFSMENREMIEKFITLFGTMGFFYLAISDGSRNSTPLWCAQLPSFTPQAPEILRQS